MPALSYKQTPCRRGIYRGFKSLICQEQGCLVSWIPGYQQAVCGQANTNCSCRRHVGNSVFQYLYLYLSDGTGQSNPQMAIHVYIVYFICHLEQKSNVLYANSKNRVTGNPSIRQCQLYLANVSFT